MGFSRRLPVQSLIELCRALRHNLGAGLTLVEVFRQQAKRGSAPVRPVAERMTAALEKGQSLEETLGGEKESFPPLFIDIAVVGEQTGTLPEMFGELEEYYRLQHQLLRKFRTQIFLPVVQFFLGIFIVAGMIFITGFLAESRGNQAPDPLGLGLRGAAGALKFLGFTFGFILLLVTGYIILKRTLPDKPLVENFLLRVPVIGPCLQAFALARFTLALGLTLDTGLSVVKALRLSLRATGNAAYVSRTPQVVRSLKNGEDLSMALAGAQVFPLDFQNILAASEEAGRVPEAMRHQAKRYQEEAELRMTALTRAASFGVWVIYAVFMVILIMRLAGNYLQMFNQ
jgi:type IV pilus assembly protein PilC